jgi:transcriptional regulator with XRE-family HTH domain
MTQRLMERVKHLREELGLSQEAFAERAGLKYKHYQAVEAGRKRNIQFDTLIKLAKACDLEPWELLRFDSEKEALAELQAPHDSRKKPTKRGLGKSRSPTS